MSAAMESSFATLFPSDYYSKFLEAKCRPDGRGLFGIRKTTITTQNVLGNTAGAAMVRVGHTAVMCGITLEVGAPSIGRPSDGRFAVTVTTPALSSARLAAATSSSAQDMANAALSAYVTKLVSDAGLVKPAQLGITEGVAAWVLRIDAVVINDDGNTTDAVILSVLHALAALALPETVSPDEKEVFIVPNGTVRSLGLASTDLLVPVTFALVNGSLIADPTAKEEDLADGLCTVVFNNKGAVVGVHKPAGEPLEQAQMLQLVKLAAKRAGAWFRDAATADRAGKNAPLCANATDL
jgi:exosome complex component RRP43